jgi:hypothetical protein
MASGRHGKKLVQGRKEGRNEAERGIRYDRVNG